MSAHVRPDDRMSRVTHSGPVVGFPSPTPAKDCAAPDEPAPGSDPPAAVHVIRGIHRTTDGGTPSAQAISAPFPWTYAPGLTLSTSAEDGATPKEDAPRSTLPESPVHSGSGPHSSADGWLELRIWAEMFHDAQQQRIATANRAERGGVDPDVYAPYTEALETAERVVRLQMIRCYRRTVPAEVRDWVKGTHGLAEPLMARILGHLGHPRWATPHHWEGTGANRLLITDPPFERTVSQLWQYCGHGRPGRPARGMSADDLAALGSPNLKMLVHIAAECCMKQKASPFRLVYEQARLNYAEKVHAVECVRCGPSGKPAQAGTPWSAGHQHAAALRKVGKEILRDLWQVSA